MKNIATFIILSAAYVGQAHAACPYVMDATATNIEQIDGSYSIITKFPSVNTSTQRLLATIQSNTHLNPAVRTYFAGSASGVSSYVSAQQGNTSVLIGDHSIPASGVVALEYRFNNFPAQLTGSTYQKINLGLTIYGGSDNTTPKTNFAIQFFLDTGSQLGTPASAKTTLRVQKYKFTGETASTDGQFNYVISQPVPNTAKLGIYLNQDSKQLGIIVNGIDQGYIATLPSTLDKLAFFPSANLMNIPTDSPVLGQNLSATLITDAAQMTLNYPAGTKDACGNTL